MAKVNRDIFVHVVWEETVPPIHEDSMPPEVVSIPREVWTNYTTVAKWLQDRYGYVVDGWSVINL